MAEDEAPDDQGFVDDDDTLDWLKEVHMQTEARRRDLSGRRAVLIGQRDRLVAEIDRLTKALKALPVVSSDAVAGLEGVDQERQQAVAALDTRSAPELVLAIVGNNRLTGPEIVIRVQKLNPTFEPATIFSAINRLLQRRELAFDGAKGQRVYFSPPTPTVVVGEDGNLKVTPGRIMRAADGQKRDGTAEE